MSDSPAGFFGKLPVTGDFVQRRLGASFVSAWDEWLQHVVHVSREQLGQRWLEHYLGSPLWRFAISPGACGESGYAGVLAPSVDSVGRYFPLVVARPLRPHETALRVAAGAQRWFEAAQACVVAVLQDRSLTLDQFDRSVLALGSSVAGVPEVPRELPTGDHFERTLSGIDDIGAHVAALAGDRIDGHLAPACHWWTLGSDHLHPSWMCSRSLPSPALFTHMLSGDALHASTPHDGELLAGLLGPTDAPVARIDDAHADILGLFGEPAVHAEPSELASAGTVFDGEVTQPRAPVAVSHPVSRAAPRPAADPLDLSDLLGPSPPEDFSLGVARAAGTEMPSVPAVAPALVADEPVTRRRPSHEELHAMIPGALSLPDDLSELIAPAHPESSAVRVRTTLRREDCGLTVVAATDQAGNVLRRAADAVLARTREMRPAELGSGLQAMRDRLLDVHGALVGQAGGRPLPTAEQCSVVAARVQGNQASVLRFGAAAAWRWRRAHLQSLFALDFVDPSGPETLPDDALDDLLFPEAPQGEGGIGAPGIPVSDESSCAVQPGDRLMLAVTRRMVQLSPDVLVRCLAMRTVQEASARIAVSAGIGGDPASWPFAVVEIVA